MNRRSPLVALLACSLAAAGCASGTQGQGGPYVEVWPSAELDLGRIQHDTTAEVEVTFRNVGPITWHLEWLDVLANVAVECPTDDGCTEAAPGASVTWRLVATSLGADGDKTARTRVAVTDVGDSEGGAGPSLEEVTVSVGWTTCGREVSCDAPM